MNRFQTMLSISTCAATLRPRNVLLLDEPSNHLDIGAVQALTDGLMKWDGALLAVSHNKEFCESLNPTHIIRVKNGELTMENCYGLTDKDFDHEVVEGDATSLAVEAAAAAVAEATAETATVTAAADEAGSIVKPAAAAADLDFEHEFEELLRSGSMDEAADRLVPVSR
jgi:ABC-type sulfate/molybdate transport systems ATPase subunit